MIPRLFHTLFASSLVAVILFSLTACVYRLDVQQGNEITREMIAQVKPGMTRREVVKVLGYPLVNDPFNRDRWDYFYSFKSGKTREITQRSAKLYFEGDYLTAVENDIAADGDSAQ